MNLISISTIVKVVFTIWILALIIKILYFKTPGLLLGVTSVILYKVRFVRKLESRGDLCITE